MVWRQRVRVNKEIGVRWRTPTCRGEMWATYFCCAALGGGAHFGRNARSGHRAQPLCGVPQELAGGEEQHPG
jgi:hypothetical protein